MNAPDTLSAVREYAAHSWDLFTRERNHNARLTDWEQSTSPDGSVLVSARVDGLGARAAASGAGRPPRPPR